MIPLVTEIPWWGTGLFTLLGGLAVAIMVQLFNIYNARRKSKDDARLAESVLRREALIDYLQASHDLRAASVEQLITSVPATKVALLRLVLMLDDGMLQVANKYYEAMLVESKYTIHPEDGDDADKSKAQTDVQHAEMELLEMARKNYRQFALPPSKFTVSSLILGQGVDQQP